MYFDTFNSWPRLVTNVTLLMAFLLDIAVVCYYTVGLCGTFCFVKKEAISDIAMKM
jgi:hypothetical protein